MIQWHLFAISVNVTKNDAGIIVSNASSTNLKPVVVFGISLYDDVNGNGTMDSGEIYLSVANLRGALTILSTDIIYSKKGNIANKTITYTADVTVEYILGCVKNSSRSMSLNNAMNNDISAIGEFLYNNTATNANASEILRINKTITHTVNE